jgi:hypothetical protein
LDSVLGLPITSVVFLTPFVACAQIVVGQTMRPQVVFAGGESSVVISLTNPSEQNVEAAFDVRVSQIAGAIAAPLGGPKPWKKAALQSSQSVIENLRISLPAVRVATRFRVEVLDGAMQSVGRLLVLGCPPDILKRLGDLGGERGPGLFDPGEVLAPAMRAAGASFVELERAEALADFAGQLVIAELSGKDAAPQEWRKAAGAAAKRGVAVILLLPADGVARTAGFMDLEGYVTIDASAAGRIAILQRAIPEPLATSAAAQFALVQLAEMLIRPPDATRTDAP